MGRRSYEALDVHFFEHRVSIGSRGADEDAIWSNAVETSSFAVGVARSLLHQRTGPRVANRRSQHDCFSRRVAALCRSFLRHIISVQIPPPLPPPSCAFSLLQHPPTATVPNFPLEFDNAGAWLLTRRPQGVADGIHICPRQPSRRLPRHALRPQLARRRMALLCP